MDLACQGEGLEAHKVVIGFMEGVLVEWERDMVETLKLSLPGALVGSGGSC